jgi:ferredoxin-NADP reductase
MLTSSASIALGLAFVALGGINIWLVLESWSGVKTGAGSRMLTLHRIGGYLFIALFCGMAYFMMARLRNGDTSPAGTLHLALAMILAPLLFIKVLIARYYRNQHALLMPIGLTVFVLAFVLIASTTAPHLARLFQPERASINPASDLMQRRCSKCHNLDRVVGARKDAPGWLATVNRMRAMPSADIQESEVQQITAYLVSQSRPPSPGIPPGMEVTRSLVDQRCGRCHNLDRVYRAVQTPDQWRETVTRMVAYAAGSAGALQPGEDRRIIDYLAATQTPEAVSQRKARADLAAASGRSLIAPASASPAGPPPDSRYDVKTVGFLSFVCLAVIVLIVRRPGKPAGTGPPAVVSAPPPSRPFLLQLVQITPQTHDSKTLRFVVPDGQRLDTVPGQFLTFAFLFDGRKEIRCYSICSSPARTAYVEITPKRVEGGCVSVFLNDRAAIGMTVEATGPFGNFCLNPAEEKQILLLAAGSGITPMMAMLRYIDDLCCGTDVTLVYCVRTKQDLIFHRELEELQNRMPNFRYRVLLSQPDPDWTGASGRISPEIIRDAVPGLRSRMVFLCGPPPFMEAARGILMDLDVPPDRIRQETFGGAGAVRKPPGPGTAQTGLNIRFSRSGKTAPIPAGRTLLEVAAENGVAIPSACRQGQCGTCKTRLIAGEVQMSVENGLTADAKAQGWILTCVGRAAGDVTLDA